jgi:N,N'-diacetyllegionaminate synthase
MKNTFIIAEAGVNHNGLLETAVRMVHAAADAGADAVKFQTFHAERLVGQGATKAEYQKVTTDDSESQLQMLKRLELSPQAHSELHATCRKRAIEFLSSPFDLQSVDYLASLGLGTLKIPSGEATNLPYLRKVGALKRRVILSSGMCTLAEVRDALEVLTSSGTKREDIVVLHCTTEYPTPFEDVNLRAMLTMRDTLDVRVGYSDHTRGMEVAVAAVAMGAEVIERHFTLDRAMKGPDHRASLEPRELKQMVESIRKVERALGDGIKRPAPSERKNIFAVRKSIVAARDIRRGELFTDENLTVKRPATGISPMKWDSIVGKSAQRAFREGEAIET